MEEVTFHRVLIPNVRTFTPENGWVTANYELVTGIGALGVGLEIDWRAKKRATKDLGTVKHAMPAYTASRLLDFCRAAARTDNFDCHGFVSYLMGWQNTFAKRSAPVKLAGSALTDFGSTRPNRPYMVYVPGAREPYAHSFYSFGDEGLSVHSTSMPLAISKHEDHQRIYGERAELYALRHP